MSALTMVAFAANSLLTREALVAGDIDVASFGALRLGAGAVVLVGLSLWLRRDMTLVSGKRALSIIGLLAYIVGFTAAYVGMDAGLGALLLFGTVQVAMFAGAAVLREPLPGLRVAGALVALGGLIYLVWPWQGIADSKYSVVMMVIAGIGWGLYSLVGRGSGNALGDTAVNFAAAALLFPLVIWALMGVPESVITTRGATLAVISGAVTSGLGYALWYSILPRLGASVGAVAQLTVPPIAMLGGVLMLGETLSSKAILATLIILGGVAVSIIGPSYFTKRSKAS
ncbi:DMT family transporter [uncultured Pelagimonas sp.]|uniref:DMT family transporter n=1 Tax=uncultured Pelagimonas sp. TaxID=1618102 RepID=UPI0026086B0F|nr:DMT family transporter [uncultured Pelagimonas sp.]